MRIFLDANVLFSASAPESSIGRLVKTSMVRATLIASDLAVAEARRNLTLKRQNWLPGFEALLEQVELVPSAIFALPVELEQKDVPILCSAIRAECDYLVTGDRRDFGHLFDQAIHETTVISPIGLAALLVRDTGAH